MPYEWRGFLPMKNATFGVFEIAAHRGAKHAPVDKELTGLFLRERT